LFWSGLGCDGAGGRGREPVGGGGHGRGWGGRAGWNRPCHSRALYSSWSFFRPSPRGPSPGPLWGGVHSGARRPGPKLLGEGVKARALTVDDGSIGMFVLAWLSCCVSCWDQVSLHRACGCPAATIRSFWWHPARVGGPAAEVSAADPDGQWCRAARRPMTNCFAYSISLGGKRLCIAANDWMLEVSNGGTCPGGASGCRSPSAWTTRGWPGRPSSQRRLSCWCDACSCCRSAASRLVD